MISFTITMTLLTSDEGDTISRHSTHLDVMKMGLEILLLAQNVYLSQSLGRKRKANHTLVKLSLRF